MAPRVRRLPVEGGSLAYTDDGSGDRVVVLLHGLMLSRRMHEPLAGFLAARGHRVINLDLLGHGSSSRPVDMTLYSIEQYAEQVVAALDHLGIEEATTVGTSLGANVSLELAASAPRRLRGMVVEMPVLDNALPATAVTFVPIMLACTLATPVLRGLSLGARAVPRSLAPFWVDVGLDVLRQDPAPTGALLQGILFGRAAPPSGRRRAIETPTLVIGHRRDPIHPFSDAGMLAAELRNGRLVEASSLLELRLRPERLSAVIGDFLDECWELPARRRPRAASA